MLSLLGIPGGLPSWRQLEREAEEVRQRIGTGAQPWPPTEGTYRILLQGLGRGVPPWTEFSPHRFACFLGLPTVLRIAARLLELTEGEPQVLVQQAVATTLHEIFHLARWTHFGRRVYVIERDTFEMLAHSDLPDMPAEYLLAPLPHFYVRFPDTAFHFDIPGDPVPQPAEGVMVGFDEAGPTPGQLREVSFLITGHSDLGPQDDNLAFASGVIQPDAPISQLTMPEARQAVDRVGQDALSRMVPRAVFALCLYLQSEHPVLEPVPPPKRRDPSLYAGKKRRRIEKENERTSALGYIRVGRPLEDVKGVERDSAGKWRLDHQVWVRGHWRLQAHGPRHSLRKLIYIRPHLRGPDLAESAALHAARVQPARRRTTD